MNELKEIPKEILKTWIVDDLTNLFNKFDDNRYSVFEDIQFLDHLADNIKSLSQQSMKVWTSYLEWTRGR